MLFRVVQVFVQVTVSWKNVQWLEWKGRMEQGNESCSWLLVLLLIFCFSQSILPTATLREIAPAISSCAPKILWRCCVHSYRECSTLPLVGPKMLIVLDSYVEETSWPIDRRSSGWRAHARAQPSVKRQWNNHYAAHHLILEGHALNSDIGRMIESSQSIDDLLMDWLIHSTSVISIYSSQFSMRPIRFPDGLTFSSNSLRGNNRARR